MRRAIRLAMNGRGRVEPNPMVGCVIVKNGQIIGEGWHKEFGGPHAEPNALADCIARCHDPRGATTYVTLEPCCHTTKKTPPCAPTLIQAGIDRVVIGCVDPYHEVNGGGVTQLQSAGIRVDRSSLEAQAKQLIAPFIATIVQRRPYVTLKWAQTADGRMAGPGGRRLQISNQTSMRIVHQLRARCDAIMVGIRTVTSDDPLLIARGVPDPRMLTRVVLDPDLQIPLTSRLVSTVVEHPLIVYCRPTAFEASDRAAVRTTLQSMGVQVVAVPEADRRLSIPDVFRDLGSRGVTHLLVEPGPSLAAGMLWSDLAQRVWVFRSPNRLDDEHAPKAPPQVRYWDTGRLNLDGDVLTEYLNLQSPLFFAPEPSADFILAAQSPSS